jgi:hypothetical protein
VIDARTPYNVVAPLLELNRAARERDSEVPFDQQQQSSPRFMGDPALASVAGGLFAPLDFNRVGVADVVFVREEIPEKPTMPATSVDGSVAELPLAVTSSPFRYSRNPTNQSPFMSHVRIKVVERSERTGVHSEA